MPRVGDVPAAIGLLTRLPVAVDPEWAAARGAKGVWAYPLVGVIVGGAVLAIGAGLSHVPLPALVIGCAMVAVGLALTGALHEDGFGDMLDGLWGGWTVERRLEIMKDSRIGIYALCGLALVLVAKASLWTTAVSTAPLAIVGMAVVSRAWMPVVMWALPHARDGGLSKSVGRPAFLAVAVGMAIGGVLGLGMAGFWPVVVSAVAAGCVAGLAHWKIKGQTGDILGACQVLSEVAGLCVVVAVTGA